MYPQQYFQLFPSNPTEPKVFVAMQFDERHNARWENVIRPAIVGISLEAYRVDAGRVSESILTQILQGIGSSQLVFADVSPLDGQRNANVMYEVGIAHASRAATEVIIFRDDNERLPFDVANVRVNPYAAHPDVDPEKAKDSVQAALQDALNELDLTKSMAVQLVMQRLDETSFNLLLTALGTGSVPHPQQSTMRQVAVASDTLRSLTLLLELGLLKPEYPNFYELAQKLGTPDMEHQRGLPVTYSCTELGQATMMKILMEHGGLEMVNDPELRAQFESALRSES